LTPPPSGKLLPAGAKIYKSERFAFKNLRRFDKRQGHNVIVYDFTSQEFLALTFEGHKILTNLGLEDEQ